MSQDAEAQGRDVGWAVEQGETKPIREVLQERATNQRAYKRSQLDAAYRERAGMIAELGVCLCAYPLVIVPTPSGHEPWCPSEGLRRSREAATVTR